MQMGRRLLIGILAAMAVSLCWLGSMQVSAAGKAPKSLQWVGASNKISMNAKEKKKLSVQVLPADSQPVKLVWKSSNKKVAAVSKDGTVTARKKGTAKITCYVKSKKKIKVTCKVKVNPAPTAKLQWTNSATERAAAVKMSVTLKTNLKKSKVKWKSSNKKIATVSSSGKVSFKKTGTVTITCKQKNKSSNQVKCRFTVKKRASKLSLSSTGTQILQVGNTCRRTTKVSASDAYGEVTWSTSNGKVASVSADGTVFGNNAGTASITATLKDGSKKKVTYSVKVIDRILQGNTKFIAHRGYSSVAPENTAAAFELAGQAGFWGAECDVQMTRDGKFVIMHDASMLRMCGINRKVSDMMYAEVKEATIINGNMIASYQGQKVPSLEEYLTICKRYNMVPVIEIKMAYNRDEEDRITPEGLATPTEPKEPEEPEQAADFYPPDTEDGEQPENHLQQPEAGEDAQEDDSLQTDGESTVLESEALGLDEEEQDVADSGIDVASGEGVTEIPDVDETDGQAYESSELKEEAVTEEIEEYIPQYPEVHFFNGQELQSVDGSTLERLYKETKAVMGSSPYVFIAFDYNNLMKIKRLKEKDPTGGNIQLQHLSSSASTLQSYPYSQDHVGLDIQYGALAPSKVAGIIGQGIPVNVWTLDNEEKTSQYVKAGTQYITTNVKVWH